MCYNYREQVNGRMSRSCPRGHDGIHLTKNWVWDLLGVIGNTIICQLQEDRKIHVDTCRIPPNQ